MNHKFIVLALILAFGSMPIDARTEFNLLEQYHFEQLEISDLSVMEVLAFIRSKVSGEAPIYYEGNLPIEIRFSPSKMNQSISLSLKNVSLQKALEALCKAADITFSVVDDRLVFEDQKAEQAGGRQSPKRPESE